MPFLTFLDKMFIFVKIENLAKTEIVGMPFQIRAIFGPANPPWIFSAKNALLGKFGLPILNEKHQKS